MRRAPLVAVGTVAGIAGVLSFPVEKPHLALTIPPASNGGKASTTSTSSTTTTAPPPPATTTTTTAPPPPATTTTTSPPPPPPPPASGTATGAEEAYQYGQLAVTVTVSGGRITNVSMANLTPVDQTSAGIDQYAVPQLEQQVIAADSANIHGVSGATYTSRAFIDSVASALSKLGFPG